MRHMSYNCMKTSFCEVVEESWVCECCGER